MIREIDSATAERAHRLLQVLLVVGLVGCLVMPSAVAQTETTTTDEGPAPCADGPPIYGEDPGEDGGRDLEVVLVNDVSHSMDEFGRMDAMREASNLFIDQLSTPDEVGLVSFGADVTLQSELTTNYAAVQSDVDALTADPSAVTTDVAGGITAAQEELLNGSEASAGAQKVMVMFGDGGAFDESAAVDAAQEAAANDIVVITVGLEENEEFYAEMASGERFAYFAPSQDELAGIYEQISEDVEDVFESELIIETRSLYQPGATHDYRVLQRIELSNNRTIREDVTDDANVSTTNTSVLSVDEQAHTLSATSDANTSTWVRVDASANGTSGCTNVIVAQPTVGNLELIPGLWRVNTVLSDSTLFAILIAGLVAVIGTRMTTAWGGLALGQMALVIGWLGGYVGFGIAAVGLFTALFIGLNLAANIDYQMGGIRR